MSLSLSGINLTQAADVDVDVCSLPSVFGTSNKNRKVESSLMGSSDAVEPYAGGYTYHQIILIVSAVTTTLCLIFSVSLASVHLSNWVKPKEQKQ